MYKEGANSWDSERQMLWVSLYHRVYRVKRKAEGGAEPESTLGNSSAAQECHITCWGGVGGWRELGEEMKGPSDNSLPGIRIPHSHRGPALGPAGPEVGGRGEG